MSTIKLRLKKQDGKILVRALITHPMENGRRLDPATGTPVPVHFIEELRLELNGRVVADGRLSTAVSRDPYFSFRLLEGQPGDRIRLTWIDNRGASDSAEAVID